jgi:hypothetical protein
MMIVQLEDPMYDFSRFSTGEIFGPKTLRGASKIDVIS